MRGTCGCVGVYVCAHVDLKMAPLTVCPYGTSCLNEENSTLVQDKTILTLKGTLEKKACVTQYLK